MDHIEKNYFSYIAAVTRAHQFKAWMRHKGPRTATCAKKKANSGFLESGYCSLCFYASVINPSEVAQISGRALSFGVEIPENVRKRFHTTCGVIIAPERRLLGSGKFEQDNDP